MKNVTEEKDIMRIINLYIPHSLVQAIDNVTNNRSAWVIRVAKEALNFEKRFDLIPEVAQLLEHSPFDSSPEIFVNCTIVTRLASHLTENPNFRDREWRMEQYSLIQRSVKALERLGVKSDVSKHETRLNRIRALINPKEGA